MSFDDSETNGRKDELYYVIFQQMACVSRAYAAQKCTIQQSSEFLIFSCIVYYVYVIIIFRVFIFVYLVALNFFVYLSWITSKIPPDQNTSYRTKTPPDQNISKFLLVDLTGSYNPSRTYS